MKKVIGIEAVVHQEQGTWIDWWVDVTDEYHAMGIRLPYEEDECIKFLEEYDIILVGDKWFPGKDAAKAYEECFRQYRKITILDDEDNVVAEIYDKQTIFDATEDYGRYLWQSQTYGNVERSFADVLEGAEEGETYKHNYKGWGGE